MHLSGEESLAMMERYGFSRSKLESNPALGKGRQIFIAITVDRDCCQPCIITKKIGIEGDLYDGARRYVNWAPKGPGISSIMEQTKDNAFSEKLPFRHSALENTIYTVAEDLEKQQVLLLHQRQSFLQSLRRLIGIFFNKEALLLETLWVQESNDEMAGDSIGLKVLQANFSFDDAAFKSSNRQKDLHSAKKDQYVDVDCLEAERDGIVYIKSVGKSRSSWC